MTRADGHDASRLRSLIEQNGGGSSTVGQTLIGGSGNTIALQPLSISGNTGLNVAGGIGAITLTPAR